MDTVFGWMALALWAVFYAVDGLLRSYLHYRSTGSAGLGRPELRPSQFIGGAVAFAGVVAAVSGAVLAATERLGALPLLDVLAVRVAGAVVAIACIGAVFAAQTDMGGSWRANVDHTERTELVRTGMFAVIRNPIFTLIVITALGLALMTPNAVALVGVVMVAAGINMHVRFVEEPYLRSAHGNAYLEYAACVGRFVPRIGRMRIDR